MPKYSKKRSGKSSKKRSKRLIRKPKCYWHIKRKYWKNKLGIFIIN